MSREGLVEGENVLIRSLHGSCRVMYNVCVRIGHSLSGCSCTTWPRCCGWDIPSLYGTGVFEPTTTMTTIQRFPTNQSHVTRPLHALEKSSKHTAPLDVLIVMFFTMSNAEAFPPSTSRRSHRTGQSRFYTTRSTNMTSGTSLK